MAGSILTAPSTTLSTNTVWQNELAYTEGARYGYDGVSLTQWASGNTTKPEIASGSTIEINGAMAEYATDTALTDIGGLADGWCYIKHVVAGTVVTPTLTNTFGTWDTAKQGYYDGSGNRYSLFAMYRSGAVTKIFTGKSQYLNTSAYGLQTTGTKVAYYNSTYSLVGTSVSTIGELASLLLLELKNSGDSLLIHGFSYASTPVSTYLRNIAVVQKKNSTTLQVVYYFFDGVVGETTWTTSSSETFIKLFLTYESNTL